MIALFFFFTATATTEIYTLSLHDALPILQNERWGSDLPCRPAVRPPAPPRRKLLPKCRPRFHRHRALRPEGRLRRLPLAVKILPRRATTATAASASR